MANRPWMMNNDKRKKELREMRGKAPTNEAENAINKELSGLDDAPAGEGYPVKTAVYDKTGYGEIDTVKSMKLNKLLKADPSGADKIAHYTNQFSNDPMQKYNTHPTNMMALAQDKYMGEMEKLSGGIKDHKKKKRN